jgi:hypothetical protein
VVTSVPQADNLALGATPPAAGTWVLPAGLSLQAGKIAELAVAVAELQLAEILAAVETILAEAAGPTTRCARRGPWAWLCLASVRTQEEDWRPPCN